MFKNLGVSEILIVVLILVVLFGGKKISQLAKGAGEAGRELKKAKDELKTTVDEVKKDSN